MDEVDETALRQARERLADDAHVAALLAAGDPAAERAALALAINAGSAAALSSASLRRRPPPGAARLPRVAATILRKPRRETGPNPSRGSGA